jgi:hypothetical protein
MLCKWQAASEHWCVACAAIVRAAEERADVAERAKIELTLALARVDGEARSAAAHTRTSQVGWGHMHAHTWACGGDFKVSARAV